MADDTGQGARDQVEEALARLERDGIQHVRFELPDMHGSARSKQVPVERFAASAREGVNMYGGIVALDTASHVISGTLYNEEVKYKDQTLRPDLSTLATVPWLDGMAKVICDTEWEDGTPLHAAPRHVARRMLERTAELGFGIESAHEYEFFVLDRETHRAALRRCPYLQQSAQRPPAGDPRGGRQPARSRHPDADGQRRVRAIAVRAGLQTCRGDGGPRQRVYLQERGQGDRPARRPHRDLHGQAGGGHGGLRLPLPHQPDRAGERAERLLRPRKPAGYDADAPAFRPGPHRPRCRLHGALQPDAQLLPPAHAPHLRALQRQLGRGGPERHGAHQAARRTRHACGDAGLFRDQQSLSLCRRNPRLRAARA